MRLHVPTPRPRDDGDFRVHCNAGDDDGPFAMIKLSEDGHTEICLDTLDDADRLIRAAVTAKRRLEAATARQPHEFSTDDTSGYSCAECGLIRADRVHDAPACPSVSPDGDDADARAANVEGIPDATPLCESGLPLRIPGHALTCALDAGHDGPHQALGGKRRWDGDGEAAAEQPSGFVTADGPVLRGAQISGNFDATGGEWGPIIPARTGGAA